MSFAIIMGLITAYSLFAGLSMAHAVDPELSFSNPVERLGDNLAAQGKPAPPAP